MDHYYQLESHAVHSDTNYYPVIDHVALDNTYDYPWMYGTMRSNDKSKPGNQLLTFSISKLQGANAYVQSKLSAPQDQEKWHFLGISKTLRRNEDGFTVFGSVLTDGDDKYFAEIPGNSD